MMRCWVVLWVVVGAVVEGVRNPKKMIFFIREERGGEEEESANELS
jgi:hypothetical protein